MSDTDDELLAEMASRPELVEKFVLENIDLETLNRWARQRAAALNEELKPPNGCSSLAQWRFSLNADKRNMLEEMTGQLREEGTPSKSQIMSELAACISAAINADMVNIYLVESEGELTLYPRKGDGAHKQAIGSGRSIAAHCAKVKDIIRTDNSGKDPRFPLGVLGYQGPGRVLCHPICSDEEELEAVLEFVRVSGPAFDEDDIETVNSYLVWGGIAIHYADQYSKVQHQKFVNDFLLTVVKSIFQEMISMDTLIVQIMNQAQKLVSADRASLFLVDSKTNQLYARIFDVSCDEDSGEMKQGDNAMRSMEENLEFHCVNKATNIDPFPIGKGIAGHVAETGETLNVADVYMDERFNPGIDEQTGYITKSILCMPICIRGTVIGVVQMVNKQHGDGVFTKEDEEAFRTFAVYCGLALHHAKLYDKIRRSEQKYKVALEVLSYHNAASIEEVEEILTTKDTDEPIEEIASFSYYATGLSDMEKVKKALFMFVDLFGLDRFEKDTLVRFFITVKKNYRSVAYHNWAHGFHVANSIYSMLKNSPGVFNPLESLAMFIGALCHDLDHRGFNNKFMIDIGSPLASIYSTSTMENHHFNMAINILQQEHHNIFSKLNPDEYKQVLGNMKHCILATDLALFFPNKARLSNLVREKTFSWDVPQHR